MMVIGGDADVDAGARYVLLTLGGRYGIKLYAITRP